MMSKLSGLVFLCVLALPIPAAWSDEAPSASPAATTEAPAASTPAAATAAAQSRIDNTLKRHSNPQITKLG